jgi:hypothetical protein
MFVKRCQSNVRMTESLSCKLSSETVECFSAPFLATTVSKLLRSRCPTSGPDNVSRCKYRSTKSTSQAHIFRFLGAGQGCPIEEAGLIDGQKDSSLLKAAIVLLAVTETEVGQPSVVPTSRTWCVTMKTWRLVAVPCLTIRRQTENSGVLSCNRRTTR